MLAKIGQSIAETKQTTVFLPKIIKVFLECKAQFYKIWKVRFGQFLKIILSMSPKRRHQAKKYISSGRWSKAQNSDQNRINPSTLPDFYFTLFKGAFKKM